MADKDLRSYNQVTGQWESIIDTNFIEEVDTTSYDATVKVYTIVNYKRLNNTLYMKSVLSNLVSGNYTTDTWTYYSTDGTTVTKTVTWTLVYDTNGNVTKKTPSVI